MNVFWLHLFSLFLYIPLAKHCSALLKFALLDTKLNGCLITSPMAHSYCETLLRKNIFFPWVSDATVDPSTLVLNNGIISLVSTLTIQEFLQVPQYVASWSITKIQAAVCSLSPCSQFLFTEHLCFHYSICVALWYAALPHMMGFHVCSCPDP